MAAFEAIAATTLGSSTTTITFSSIPSTYEHLQIRAYLRGDRTGGGDSATIRLNNDSGANYAVHRLVGSGSTASADATIGRTSAFLARGLPTPGYSATVAFSVTVCDIVDYASPNKNTTIRCLSGADVSSDGSVEIGSGLWISTAAVNRIDIICATNNFVTGSVVSLYGLRSS